MLILIICEILYTNLVTCLLNLRTGLALVTKNDARLWTDGRYFLQATQELSDQWTLMRIGEDPSVDIWMADVSQCFLKTFLRIIILSLKVLWDVILVKYINLFS